MATVFAQMAADNAVKIAKEAGVELSPYTPMSALFGMKTGTLIQNSNGAVAAESLGYKAITSTLTYINQTPIRQQFYTLFGGKTPADFVPIRPGTGAWAESAFTRLTYTLAGDFESGFIGSGSSANDRSNLVDMGVSSKTTKRMLWKKIIEWNNADIGQASFIQGFDLIGEKIQTVNEHYALGMQEWAFLGSSADADFTGLLTLEDVNSDTASLTAPLSGLSLDNLSIAIKAMLASYRLNCNRTAYPTHMLIPESDWNGLGVLIPATAGVTAKNRFEIIKDAFKHASGIDINIEPAIYGMPAYNASRGLGSGSGLNRYVMYKKDEKVLCEDIPVPLMVTNPGTINNFDFQCAAVSQIGGVNAFIPQQVEYFDFAA